MKPLLEALVNLFERIENEMPDSIQCQLAIKLKPIFNNFELGNISTNAIRRKLNDIVSDWDLPIPQELIDIFHDTEYGHLPFETEPIERFSNVHHRDHFYHTLHLFALGWFLIDSSADLRKELMDLMEISDGAVLRHWAFCAIIHDFGYFIELNELHANYLAASIHQSLSEENFILMCACKRSFCENIKNHERVNDLRLIEPCEAARKRLKEQLDLYFKANSRPILPRIGVKNIPHPFLEYISRSKSDNHGKASAELMKLCKDMAEAFIQTNLDVPSEYIRKDWKILDNAIQAVSLHNDFGTERSPTSHIDSRDFSRNLWIPFLHIVDEMQDYDRLPLARPSHGKEVLSAEQVYIATTNEKITLLYPQGKPPKIDPLVVPLMNRWGIGIQVI